MDEYKYHTKAIDVRGTSPEIIDIASVEKEEVDILSWAQKLICRIFKITPLKKYNFKVACAIDSPYSLTNNIVLVGSEKLIVTECYEIKSSMHPMTKKWSATMETMCPLDAFDIKPGKIIPMASVFSESSLRLIKK